MASALRGAATTLRARDLLHGGRVHKAIGTWGGRGRGGRGRGGGFCLLQNVLFDVTLIDPTMG